MKMKKKVRKTRRQLQAEKVAAAKQIVDRANSLADPLEGFDQYRKYTTKDGEEISLSCVKAQEASPECSSWVFDITERNMKHMYEQSDWGWDATEKQNELTEPTALYLIASCDGNMVGYSHFRFDIDYGTEVLYCYELQLEASFRRKGLGRFMMSILEHLAFHNRMQKVVLTIFTHNPSAIQFYHALGYKLDNTSPSESEKLCYVILSKRKSTGRVTHDKRTQEHQTR